MSDRDQVIARFISSYLNHQRQRRRSREILGELSGVAEHTPLSEGRSPKEKPVENRNLVYLIAVSSILFQNRILLRSFQSKEVIFMPIGIIEDVEGAPFKLGYEVRVLDNPSLDCTFDEQYIGKIGHVVHFEYDCGCGQSFPADPMIGVMFSDFKVEEFWKEELAPL